MCVCVNRRQNTGTACLFEEPAGAGALVVVADVEPRQRAEQFERLDVEQVGPGSLQLPAAEPQLAAGPVAAAAAVQHAVDACRRSGVRHVTRTQRDRVRNS